MAKSAPPRKRPKPLPAEPSWTKLEGAAPYADMVRITTVERHILLQFAQSRPGQDVGTEATIPHAVVVAQVYLPPKTAGELVAILGTHVANYEERFGMRILPDGMAVEVHEESQ